MAKIKDGFQGSRAIVLPDSVINEIEKDAFGARLHITDIGYYPRAAHHYWRRKIPTSQYVLIYCVDGKGWFEINGRTHNISPGQFFILPANVPHSYGADKKDPWTIYWIHFKGEIAGFYAEGYDVPTNIPSGDGSRIMDRLAVFEEIYATLEKGYSRDNIDYAISCLYYFLGSIKYIGKFRESNARQEHSKDVVDRAVSFMRENIERTLSLQEICEYLGYSESYFSSMFKKRTGYSPLNYFSQLKMQAACALLDFSDMKINQICHKVGIADPYYFTKLFTKTIGCSPTEYRRIKKG